MTVSKRPFRLITYFGIFSLLSIAIVTLGTNWYLGRVASNLVHTTGENAAVQVAHHLSLDLSNDILAPIFHGSINLQNDINQQQRVIAAINNATVGLNISRVDFHQTDGTLIFSTDPLVQGSLHIAPEVAAFINGLPLRPTEADRVSSRPVTPDDYSQLETFVVYESPTSGELLGIFEIYHDIAPIAVALDSAKRNITLGLTAVMSLLFIGLLAIVWQGERIIQQQQQALTAQNNTLRNLQQLKDDLTHMLIHDLKQPLTVVLGGMQLLRRFSPPSDNPRLVEIGDTSVESAHHALEMIDQLLDITRLQEGKLPLKPSPLDPAKFLAFPIDQARVHASRRNQEIIMQSEAGIPLALADEALISRVVTNLLDNALKYTPPGKAITVTVTTAPDNTIEVAVLDKGRGIPPEQRATIFDRFAQVGEYKGERNKIGSGLGLTFCQMVVQAHNGRIWVEDAPNGGSKFAFTLPAVPQTLPSNPKSAVPNPAATTKTSSPSSAPLRAG